MRMTIIEDPAARLRRLPNPDECWMWCDECHRFFQYKTARLDGKGERDLCPFSDCFGYGVGFRLLMWDDTREPDDPRWPGSVDELEHGMRSPDMEPFYRAQLMARIDHMVGELRSSPEARDALGGEPPRYVGAFLKMMSDLCWDLTIANDECGFNPELARELIDQLPVWSQTADHAEAPRMTAELRTFFEFAERTGTVRDASRWRTFLVAYDLDEIFRDTMTHDARLRAPRPKTRPKRSSGRRKKKRRRAR